MEKEKIELFDDNQVNLLIGCGVSISTEQALDEADEYASVNDERMNHEEVFGRLRRLIN